VDQRFRRNYNLLFVGDRNGHRTTDVNAVASVTTAEIWLREDTQRDDRIVPFSCAVVSGRLDVLKFLRSRGLFYSAGNDQDTLYHVIRNRKT
jgi:hypothetical protein